MNKVKKIIMCISLLSATNTFAVIGGVSLGATRVIYPIDNKQVSLPLFNYSQSDRYLVNAWIENDNNEKTKDFLITPPVFVSEPKAENTFRIIKIENNLPLDRESIYWINVKNIPSVDQEILDNSNVLQLAVLTRIKLFVRPYNLPYAQSEAVKNIKFYNSASGVMVKNESPYHISFANLKLDNKDIQNKMVRPFSEIILNNERAKKISYKTINDYGGLSESTEYSIN